MEMLSIFVIVTFTERNQITDARSSARRLPEATDTSCLKTEAVLLVKTWCDGSLPKKMKIPKVRSSATS